ncbi:unnamed protein product [Paramecium primaurelia]|uniref:Uncharacterized protein n=1 Tax=Paramecium primaurelia TaxID=5886 RepID=A0A8S1JU72_PARPR|nr:unnamed protein product [Paramecium primaurelia]
MQIKLRNYHYNGSIFKCRVPQFKIRILNLSQNKVQTSSQKYQNEKPTPSSISKVTNYEKIKKISMSLEVRNQNYTYKQPILYYCDINQNSILQNQKQAKITKRIIPQQLKAEENKLQLDNIEIGQQFKRFYERYNDSNRSKDTTQIKQQSQSKAKSKDLEIEPKGWTNRSSHSLL